MKRSLISYIEHTIRLLSEYGGIVGKEREFIERFKESFMDQDYNIVILNRILSRASFLNCLPLTVSAEQDGDAFWQQMAKNQRQKFNRYGLTAKSGFNTETCPCYICNGKCLRRLHGLSLDNVEDDDIEKGFVPWHRGHIIPNMVGEGNTNIYNYRIICSKCNSASSTMYPADYATYVLGVNQRSLATVECIASVLDALKIHFDD